ncbi:HU family DNA-binding protein [Sulfurimonas sp.]|uniref:HU family DNA-binding protein n=1 Tax=Sulfurimonas sp. TaxID=2022749 RepID=UPI0025E830B9|nr:HU family DNA-binding protein [Sulfurimonas sp.]
MNKKQFVELIQNKANYKTKTEAERAIKAFTEAVTASLEKRENVTLVGFGGFYSRTLYGRTGKVPGTDKTYTTKDKIIPKFKAGEPLKKLIEKGCK